MPRPGLIPEVLTHSPDGYDTQLCWEKLFAFACRISNVVAVNTDELWGGSLDRVRQAKRITNVTIVAKGMFNTDDEIRTTLDAGADRVVVPGRVPPFPLRTFCWIAPLGLNEVCRMLTDYDVVVGSSHDPFDGTPKPNELEQVSNLPHFRLVQDGLIKSPADIHPAADMYFVGRHLEEFVG